jgi:hypothetical protein
VLLATLLIALIALSLVITVNWFSNQTSPREFYLGVEYAYGSQASELERLVDKVRNYTNLFVIGSIQITFNQTALTESCDYIFKAGLKILVLFTSSEKYSYNTFTWMTQAKQKYEDQFLGVYRYDEPGGDQLEKVESRLVENATNYNDAAAQYTSGLKAIIDYYRNYADRIFTADYGLYWFDYQVSYTAVFAEFVGNQSRQRHIAQCRGAAQAHNRDWGAIVTWKYDNAPYLESGDELYSDLALAYRAGAKYAIVFSYPQIGVYGTLTEDHFDALKRFWSEIHSNPQSFGSSKAEVAYVLPKDYGFGLRSAEDNVWGLFNADELSAKVWNDVNRLISQYGSRLDILYDDVGFDAVKSRYERVIFWNQTN